METSLRYGGESKSVMIHAKEKFPIDSNTFLQVHGELDTGIGTPSYCSAIFRHFYPQLSASLGVGLQYDVNERFRYTVRAKKAFPITNDGLVSFIVKGRSDAGKEFTEVGSPIKLTSNRMPLQKKARRAAAELSWSMLNFQKDQDVRFKIGYEMLEKVPYLQVRENNWTLNATMDGKWNVRFDL